MEMCGLWSLFHEQAKEEAEHSCHFVPHARLKQKTEKLCCSAEYASTDALSSFLFEAAWDHSQTSTTTFLRTPGPIRAQTEWNTVSVELGSFL